MERVYKNEYNENKGFLSKTLTKGVFQKWNTLPFFVSKYLGYKKYFFTKMP